MAADRAVSGVLFLFLTRFQLGVFSPLSEVDLLEKTPIRRLPFAASGVLLHYRERQAGTRQSRKSSA
jgi:hypothetical protein